MATTSFLPALAGMLLAALQFAGALKAIPAVAALPVDATLVLALAAAPALALLAIAHPPVISGSAAIAFAGIALLALWLVLAAAWSPADAVAHARLPWLIGAPALAAAGLLIGAVPAALRGFAMAVLAIGPASGFSIALGRDSAWPVAELRVPYQSAGLALAAAGGLASLAAARARGFSRLPPLLLLAACAVLAALPGGRAALAALLASAVLAPVAFWLCRGRAGPALATFVGGTALLVAATAMLAAFPQWADGFRTLERFAQGDVAGGSGRAELWSGALRLAGDAMPFGAGTGAFPVVAGFGQAPGLHAHNHALEALAEGGLPALLLLAGAWASAALAALRGGADAVRVGTVVAVVVPVLVSIQVSSDLGNRMAWLALGMLASLGVRRA